MESELEPCPLCGKVHILPVIVDDKACNTVDSGIVSGDRRRRSGGETLSIVHIVGKETLNNFKICLLVGNIAYVDGVNLSNRCY